MKRSFFISLLLHGAVLFLFFSWGIPLGERPLARNVIQVLLVAEEVNKIIKDEPDKDRSLLAQVLR